VDATPVFHVVRCLAQKSRIVVEISKAAVASYTKEAAQPVELVTVINEKRLLGLSFAEWTSAVLPRHHVVVVLQRHPVSRLEIVFALSDGAPSKLLRFVFWVRCISVPIPRIALRPIGFFIGAVIGSYSFSIFRICCISDCARVHMFLSASSWVRIVSAGGRRPRSVASPRWVRTRSRFVSAGSAPRTARGLRFGACDATSGVKGGYALERSPNLRLFGLEQDVRERVARTSNDGGNNP
jgi:hypothetical protein